MLAQAIAQHLNIVESTIVKIEHWTNCLFVVVKGLGARFVSKKIMKTEKFQLKGLVSRYRSRKGFVRIHKEGQFQKITGEKGSNQYNVIDIKFSTDCIVELVNFFDSPYSKKPLNGFFKIVDGKLEETDPIEVQTQTKYLHEIYDEIDNPTTYQGYDY